MSEVLDCTAAQGRADAVAAAVDVVAGGGLVVLPTDTVYGIGCDAFNVESVAALLAAKGRGRQQPPPVLVPNPRTLDGLARDVPQYARVLVERFWPGPLTLVVTAQSSLLWDLGDTNGTVALRMPDDETALELLRAVGPMAVTSANRTGAPAATTAAQAREQLGEAVALYLDAGPSGSAMPSTILDCTGEAPVIVRQGALGRAAIDAAVAASQRDAAEPEAPEATHRGTETGPRPGPRRGPPIAGRRRRH
ncbi:MAG: L-threonylcarbamoyladenylate synthase [Dermatophilaceae bacterium]